MSPFMRILTFLLASVLAIIAREAAILLASSSTSMEIYADITLMPCIATAVMEDTTPPHYRKSPLT
jgi:hypothetical protein